MDYKKKYLKYKLKYLTAKKMYGGNQELLLAARGGNLEKVEALLAKGANPDWRDSNGTTALMFAAKRGHTLLVVALLAERANPDAKDRLGNTALMYAAYGGDTAMVQALLGLPQKLAPADAADATAVALCHLARVPGRRTRASVAATASSASSQKANTP